MNLSEMFKPLPKVSIGQMFRFESGHGGDYLLCCTGPNMAGLVNLNTGSRWGDTVVVKDLRNISLQEITQIVCANKHGMSLNQLELIRDSL
jgi:hypothetical protein